MIAATPARFDPLPPLVFSSDQPFVYASVTSLRALSLITHLVFAVIFHCDLTFPTPHAPHPASPLLRVPSSPFPRALHCRAALTPLPAPQTRLQRPFRAAVRRLPLPAHRRAAAPLGAVHPAPSDVCQHPPGRRGDGADPPVAREAGGRDQAPRRAGPGEEGRGEGQGGEGDRFVLRGL